MIRLNAASGGPLVSAPSAAVANTKSDANHPSPRGNDLIRGLGWGEKEGPCSLQLSICLACQTNAQLQRPSRASVQTRVRLGSSVFDFSEPLPWPPWWKRCPRYPCSAQ